VVAAVVVTLLVLAPRRLSTFALDETVILLAALGLWRLGSRRQPDNAR